MRPVARNSDPQKRSNAPRPALTLCMHTGSLPTTQLTEIPSVPLMQKSPMSGFGTTPREPPRQVGRYRLVSQLGQGGMGVVFEAEDPDLGRPVALKFMNGGPLLEEQVSRFLRESRLAARLRHPNIVTVHEVGTADLYGSPVPYLCMEIVRGRTLQEDLVAAGHDLKGVVSMLERIARAVHYAHEEGVLHRDLKPSNILIDAAGTPFLTDFGLARPLDNATQLTLSGVMIGTPDYMSPEQATGRTRDLGPWTDVWSLGVILYQAATGTLPFRKDNVLGTLSAIREDDPTPMQQLNAAVPADLDFIVRKALQKSHARRYATARDLANDLKRWLVGEKIETDSAAGSEADRAGAEAMLCRAEGNVLMGQGQPRKAAQAFEAGLALSRKCGDLVEESTALFNVADACAHAGDPQRARAGFEEALLAKAALGDRWGQAGTHNKLAWIHLEWGDPQRALKMALRGTRLAEQTEDRRMIAINRLALGQIRLSRNETGEARRECVAALDHAAAIGATPEVIECLLGLAAVDRAEGLLVRAGERVARARALAGPSGESALAEIQARIAKAGAPVLDLESMAGVCEALAGAGKVEQAAEMARSLAGRAAAIGLVSAEADARMMLARLTSDIAEARAAQALAVQAGGALRLARAARLVADLGKGAADRAAAEALKAQLLRGVPPEGVEAALAAWKQGLLPI